MSKMSSTEAEKVVKDEITKCWDDGELANYDKLQKLIRITGPNIVNDVYSIRCL